jgi:hypothetical protein
MPRVLSHFANPAPPGCILDPPFMDHDGHTSPARNLLQKRTFTAVGLDKMYGTILVIRRHDGNHKARETCAGAEVKPISRRRG